MAGMKRKLTLIRHAKAEDDGASQDHLRRLNARGREDAASLGGWLKQQKALPELFVCSTAQRTRETLQAFSVNVPTILSDRAYLASTGELISILQQTDNAVRHVALVGHNPGLHQLVATLAGDYAREADAEKLLLKFPTCACAQLEAEFERWEDLAPQLFTLQQLHLAH